MTITTTFTGAECDGERCDDMRHRVGCSLYVPRDQGVCPDGHACWAITLPSGEGRRACGHGYIGPRLGSLDETGIPLEGHDYDDPMDNTRQ